LHPDRAGRLLAAAGLYAGLEIGAALTLGGFFAWGRAEALLFLAFRPWLLLGAAVLVAGWPWPRRLAFYLLALATAGLAESLFLTALGGRPWLEMVRGWGAALALVAAVDLLVQLGRRLGGAIGRWAAAAVLLAMLLLGGQRPYEALAIGPSGPRAVEERPPLLLMTGLPLIWGETGPFDPQSRPAAAYDALQREFTIRPVDHLDARTFGGANLLLLAQPRMLEPGELAALDAWIRSGGRALILADPDLHWPSRLPPGDVRRPPPASLLTPLLDHWALNLAPALSPAGIDVHLEIRGHLRRLRLVAPGRLDASGGECRSEPHAWLAACQIGAGEALVVADADLLRDDLWAAPRPRGTERHARLADNPLVVADWLDRLAGRARTRGEPPVHWLQPDANRYAALGLAVLPILGLFASARLLRRRLT
jgi:hypothetical protein